MADIKAIDKTTVHRICSGQVVLSLAIAVKELVENSLDAGATVIDVRFKEFGSEQIEVTDNGSGIHPSNFEGLTLKHHTSKIRDFSDLMSVETFGFRGEALSSLCALSEFSVITRHESQTCGTALLFDRNGHIVEEKRQARQIGTSVFVKNLFSTLPVRQKEFHKNLKREFHKMSQLLYAYCLVSTGVKITCVNQTQKGTRTTIMTTSGCKSVKENISCLFGAKQLSSLLDLKQKIPPAEELEEIKATSEDCKMFTLEGYVSSCAHGAGKAATNRQFYFINSRPCEPSKIMKQVNQVYHQFNKHQYPFVFLNIMLDRGLADVNVTPDKRQIFLIHEKLILAIVKASLLGLYEKIPATLTISMVSQVNSVKTGILNQDGKPNFSRFEAWKHKSDLKRPYDSSGDNSATQKQIKIESSIQKTLESFDIKKSIAKNGQPSIKRLSGDSDNFGDQENNRNLHSKDCSNIASVPSVTNESEYSVQNHVQQTDVFEVSQVQEKCSVNPDKALNGNVHEDAGLSDSITPNLQSQIDIDQHTNDDFVQPVSEKQNSEEPLSEESVQVSTGQSGCEKNSESFVNEVLNLADEPKISSPFMYDESVERRSKNVPCAVTLSSIKTFLTKRIEGKKKAEATRKSANVKFRTTIDPSKNEEAENELKKEISKDMFEKMEIIGQFNLGFIIAKLESDLLIIDQHASDEKYNFETLQKTTVLNSQRLVVPQNLELAAEHECILLDNIEVFHKNGFKINIDKEAPPTKRISLTAIPMSKNMVFGKQDIDEMIFMLQDNQGNHCRPSRVRAMFASRACRKSVMIGTALNHRQMRQLINNMATIEQPWNCPHGRPTIRHLLNLHLISSTPLEI